MLKLKVEDPKKELNKRGFSIKGKKKELHKLLSEYIIQETPLVEDMVQNQADNLVGESFSPGDYWETIACDGKYLDKAVIEVFHTHALPTGRNPTTKKEEPYTIF